MTAKKETSRNIYNISKGIAFDHVDHTNFFIRILGCKNEEVDSGFDA